MESVMALRNEFEQAQAQWKLLSFYQKFEHVCILLLSGLIAIVVVFAIWHLALRIFVSIWFNTFDPTDYAVFQAVFGMIFTVIIALEFKRSLLVIADRQHSVVQVRAVVLIALLAVVRKLIILDLKDTEATQLLALAAAILALGTVYWLVRDQDRKYRSDAAAESRAPRGKSQ
jgi:uncharacterized membrane protein (DUF373 family)